MIRMSSIGFSQYSITEDGRVYSHKINKWVKQQISNNGYYVVSIGSDSGVRYRKKVHRLLLQIYKPIEDSDSYVVNHIDGDKKNNDLSNLEWCTVKENSYHALDNGLYKPSHANEHTIILDESDHKYPNVDTHINDRKLISDDLIVEIFRLVEVGYRSCDIAKLVGVSSRTINSMINSPSKKLKSILPQFDFSKRCTNSRTDKSVVVKVCELLEQDVSATKASKILGIQERVAMNIKARKTHTDISKNYTW